MKKFLLLASVLLTSVLSAAQVNAPVVGNRIDSGPSLPVTCAVFQIYKKSSSTDGLGAVGLYSCDAANTWTGPFVSSAGSGGTAVSINGGAAQPTLNYGNLPTAQANNILGVWQISGTNTSVEVPYASSSHFGVIEGDNSTLTLTAGVASCTTATTSQLGCVEPDGSTITISNGVISAVGGGSPAFNAITTGNNTTATMGVNSGAALNIGSGATLTIQNGGTLTCAAGSTCPSGSGTVTSSGSPSAGNISAFSSATNIVPATTQNMLAAMGTSLDASCTANITGAAGAQSMLKCPVAKFTLTGSVTSFSLSNLSNTNYSIYLIQDGTGARAITGVTGINGFCTLDDAANSITRMDGAYDGNTFNVTGCSTYGGYGVAAYGTAYSGTPPATSGLSQIAFWWDPTLKLGRGINAAGSSFGHVFYASGKVATFNNTLTLAGTDSTTMTFPGTSATIARTDAANTFTGTQTFSSAPVVASLTGIVRGGSPLTASELSGDATTSGSNAVIVGKINGTSLAGLATGILFNTTSTGVPSILTVGSGLSLSGSTLSATGGGSGGGGVIAYSAASATWVTGDFISPGGGNPQNATEANVQMGAAGSATISNLNVQLGAALVSGTMVVTYRSCTPTSGACTGTNRALTCSITGSALGCSDITHSFTPAAGDLVSVGFSGTFVSAATPIMVQAAWGTSNVGVTSIATTSPITGGTITSTGTIACATCVTSASSLTNYGVVAGSGGGQGSATISVPTATNPQMMVQDATGTVPFFQMPMTINGYPILRNGRLVTLFAAAGSTLGDMASDNTADNSASGSCTNAATNGCYIVPASKIACLTGTYTFFDGSSANVEIADDSAPGTGTYTPIYYRTAVTASSNNFQPYCAAAGHSFAVSASAGTANSFLVAIEADVTSGIVTKVVSGAPQTTTVIYTTPASSHAIGVPGNALAAVSCTNTSATSTTVTTYANTPITGGNVELNTTAVASQSSILDWEGGLYGSSSSLKVTSTATLTSAQTACYVTFATDTGTH
jgi:hypothetical protein